MTTRIKRNKIAKFINKYFSLNTIEGKDIVEIFEELEEKDLIDFQAVEREDGNGDNYLTIEYYSRKIDKQIIFDYDFDSFFDSEGDLTASEKITERVIKLEREINKFEGRLSIKK